YVRKAEDEISPVLCKDKDVSEKNKNRILNDFQNNWKIIAEKFSPDLVKFIFKNLYAFYVLKNGNYLQICGATDYMKKPNLQKLHETNVKKTAFKNKISFLGTLYNYDITEKFPKNHMLNKYGESNISARNMVYIIFDGVSASSNDKISRIKKEYTKIQKIFKILTHNFKKIKIKTLLNKFCSSRNIQKINDKYASNNFVPRCNKSGLRSLKDGGSIIEVPPSLHSTHCDPGKVRFFPKYNSVRVIFAFPELNKNYSTNFIQIILNSLLRDSRKVRGSSLLAFHDLSSKLSDFSQQIHSSPTLLYFVIADIKDFYHSIDRSNLFNVLDDFLPEMFISRGYSAYNLLTKSTSKFNTFSLKNIYSSCYENLTECMNNSLKRIRNSIIIDTVNAKKYPKRYIISIIMNILDSCCFRINNSIYKLTAGLPQGLKISGVLANIYLSHLEYMNLGPLLSSHSENRDSLLIRWSDDYLFITSSLFKYNLFIPTLRQSCHQYSLKLNESKPPSDRWGFKK
ncbi:hypothetical protein MXB_623, partial [Myxobolus squamalis]